MMHPLPAFAIAALALILPAGVALAQPPERCYGVALAGQADGVGEETRAGSGTVDYQGNAWILVPAGSCITRTAPPQPDGTPRRGALVPLNRDLP